MKLITKALIIFTILFLVQCNQETGVKKVKKQQKAHNAHKVHKEHKNHHSKQSLKSSINFPHRGFRKLPVYTSYHRPGALFKGIPTPFRRVNPGAVEIANRSCFALCKDRITETCSRGVVARPDRFGILECVCKKKYRRNRKVFPQADQCFDLDGCFSKPSGMSCIRD